MSTANGSVRDTRASPLWQTAHDIVLRRVSTPGLTPSWCSKVAVEVADALIKAEKAGLSQPTSEPPLPSSRPAIVQLSEVEPEDISWIWEPYIARRKLTLLEGDPGGGKTWFALSVAGILSRAEKWPVGVGRAPPGRTLYLTAEDGVGDTLRPRLDAIGADPSQVYALTGTIRINPETREEVEHGGVMIADVLTIEAALEQVRPALVVIDPIQGFLGANVDMHRANEVRPLLNQLSRWAERFDCAMLVLRHLSKSPAARGMYRGLGSIDFTATARSVLLAGEDPQSGERAVAHLKSSLAPNGPSIGYELRQPYGLVWTGTSDATAASLLAPDFPQADGEADRSALEDACNWVEYQLRDGPVAASDMRKRAHKDGLGWRTIEKAKAALSIESKRANNEWKWHSNSVVRSCGVVEDEATTGDSSSPHNAARGSGAVLPEGAELVSDDLFSEAAT